MNELLEALGISLPQFLAIQAAQDTVPRAPIAQNAIPDEASGDTLAPPTGEFVTLMDSLANAPFATDTLYEILGGTPETVSAGGLSPSTIQLLRLLNMVGDKGPIGGVMGEYKPTEDIVQVNETALEHQKRSKDNTVEDTFTHEIAHALDFANPNVGAMTLRPDASNLATKVSAWLADKLPGGATGQQVKMTKLRKDLESDLRTLRESPQGKQYAATNPREHFAEVFTIALNSLRDTNPERALTRLHEGEENITGVRRMSDFLLSLPLFKDHPLNQVEK